MTTQYAVLKGLPNGLALDAGKLFTLASPDTVVTGNTFGFSNRTNANTQYVVSIVRATALPAGDYTFIAYIGSSPKFEIALTFLGTDGETATETARLAVLDSASRLAIWNTLTTETFTADTFGELLLISDGTNGRAVKVTGANHIAADVHDCQADGLSGSTEIGNIQDAAGWLLAISSGAVANPQTATEQYDITQFGVNYRVAMAGLTSTGTRTAPTLSKPA
jgi:hypothetical protein